MVKASDVRLVGQSGATGRVLSLCAKEYFYTATSNPHSDPSGEPMEVSTDTVRNKRPSSAIPNSAFPTHGVWLSTTTDKIFFYIPPERVFPGCCPVWSRHATGPT